MFLALEPRFSGFSANHVWWNQRVASNLCNVPCPQRIHQGFRSSAISKFSQEGPLALKHYHRLSEYHIPSGKRLYNSGKSPSFNIFYGKPHYQWSIFHGYLSLSSGIPNGHAPNISRSPPLHVLESEDQKPIRYCSDWQSRSKEVVNGCNVGIAMSLTTHQIDGFYNP